MFDEFAARLISSLLNAHLTNPQNVQFLTNVKKDVGANIENVPELSVVNQAFEKSFGALESFYKQNSKFIETEEIVGEDVGRDYITRSLVAKIKFFYTYPQTEEEKEDSRVLHFITETYKKADAKDYQSNTIDVRKMILELRKHPALLVKYGLKDMVDNLEVKNNGVEALYIQRTNAKHIHKLKGDMRKLRRDANKDFANLCKTVASLTMMPISEASLAEVKLIINRINGHIEQYTTIYDRHAHVTAKHPGHNNGNNEGNGGDFTNPDPSLPPPLPPLDPDFE
ncbi:hypothetical protein FACS1894181_14340 [Bacteroidia bacterium]|nr:hypothetical protein FACS1894181_14340 [Bacteroidia bacterium]